jgi:cytochrome d ubiquinol oxidase subunit II
VLAVAIFAFLAATYLTVATKDDALREDFRRRALWAALVVVVLGGVGLSLHGDRDIFPILAGAAAVVGIWGLWSRRFRLARLAIGAQVSLILWGWAAAQYPYLIPEILTVRSAAAPRTTLVALLWVMVGGAVILIPSLRYLMRLFASRESLPE